MKEKLFLIGTVILILFLQEACVKFEESLQDDKPKWVLLDSKNGLANNTILCLEEYPKNTIWIGTMEGLYIINSLNPTPKLYKSLIALSLEAADDGLLVASDWGSLIIKNERIKYIDQTEVYTGMVSWGDFLFTTTYDKLKFSLLNSNMNTILEIKESYISNLYADNDYLWVSTLGSGLFKVDKKKQTIIKNYKTADGLTSDTCLISFHDSKDRIWIGVNSPTSGLLQVLEDKIISYNFGFINSITEDKEGNLWLGSLGNGIYKWEKNGNILNYTMLDGLPSNYIKDILITDNGTIWFATETSGIVQLNLQNE